MKARTSAHEFSDPRFVEQACCAVFLHLRNQRSLGQGQRGLSLRRQAAHRLRVMGNQAVEHRCDGLQVSLDHLFFQALHHERDHAPNLLRLFSKFLLDQCACFKRRQAGTRREGLAYGSCELEELMLFQASQKICERTL
ncbi:hypothetical protein D9M68_892080 [compost metagenome]